MAYDKEKLQKMIDRIQNASYYGCVVTKEVAEKHKLKGNEFYKNYFTCLNCKNHMFSDNYLECTIHNRINNKDACEDFERVKE